MGERSPLASTLSFRFNCCAIVMHAHSRTNWHSSCHVVFAFSLPCRITLWNHSRYYFSPIISSDVCILFPPLPERSPPPLFNIHGFSAMFTTAIFSQLFQHSVPNLIRPLNGFEKNAVPKVFGYALITTASIYIAIGSTCVYYFGEDTNESINLNFVNYTWGLSSTSSFFGLAKFFSMLIVLFPVLDTLSVFPLIANTLASNLSAAFPRLRKLTLLKGKPKKFLSVFWGLVASVPPIITSRYIQDLSTTLQIAGVCGIIVAFIIPSLLQMAAEKRFSTVPLALRLTPYSTSTAVTSTPWIVLCVGALALIVCVWQMF